MKRWYIARSAIAGRGIFASTDIPAGGFILSATGKVLCRTYDEPFRPGEQNFGGFRSQPLTQSWPGGQQGFGNARFIEVSQRYQCRRLHVLRLTIRNQTCQDRARRIEIIERQEPNRIHAILRQAAFIDYRDACRLEHPVKNLHGLLTANRR